MELTKAIIDKLCSRRGVRVSVVSSFLSNITEDKIIELEKLETMKQYNKSTMNAIRDGIRIRFDD